MKSSNTPPLDWLPFRPLWRYAEAQADLAHWDDVTLPSTSHGFFTAKHAADYMGLNYRTLHRYKSWDKIPIHAADRVCIRLGIHPVELWGDLWIDDDARARFIALGERAFTVFEGLRREYAA